MLSKSKLKFRNNFKIFVFRSQRTNGRLNTILNFVFRCKKNKWPFGYNCKISYFAVKKKNEWPLGTKKIFVLAIKKRKCEKFIKYQQRGVKLKWSIEKKAILYKRHYIFCHFIQQILLLESIFTYHEIALINLKLT